MKRYDSYKDSRVEWIGEVPNHWDTYRIKYNTFLKGRIGWQGLKSSEFLDEGYCLITGTDFDNKGGVNWNTCYRISEERFFEDRLLHVKEGDILITKDGTVGKLALIKQLPEPASLNSHLLIVRQKSNLVNNSFLYYCLFCSIFKDFTEYHQTGSIMNSISQDLFSYFKCYAPHVTEQQEIANYLDSKCDEIDKVISTQEKRVALLQELKQSIITHAVTKGLNHDVKMKDSGIEWIGEVPEHWKIIRMKYICEFNGRIGFRGYSQADLVSEGEGAITLSPTNMNDMYVDYNKCSYLSWKKYYESPEIMVKQGDVLLVKTASVGKCSYVKTIPMECTVNPQILVLKKHRQNPMFLTYLFQISLGQTYIELYKAGSTIPTLSEDKIGNFRFAFPSDNEQNEIVSYLDKRCSSIDASISKAQREIELLQEYKQSLITEVVTGKRKVC